jgi:hypothetical protein
MGSKNHDLKCVCYSLIQGHRVSVTKPHRELQCFERLIRRGRKVVDSGGLEKLKRRLAIWHKIQLNPFASRQIAGFPLFLSSLVFACFAAVLVTIW